MSPRRQFRYCSAHPSRGCARRELRAYFVKLVRRVARGRADHLSDHRRSRTAASEPPVSRQGLRHRRAVVSLRRRRAKSRFRSIARRRRPPSTATARRRNPHSDAARRAAPGRHGSRNRCGRNGARGNALAQASWACLSGLIREERRRMMLALTDPGDCGRGIDRDAGHLRPGSVPGIAAHPRAGTPVARIFQGDAGIETRPGNRARRADVFACQARRAGVIGCLTLAVADQDATAVGSAGRRLPAGGVLHHRRNLSSFRRSSIARAPGRGLLPLVPLLRALAWAVRPLVWALEFLQSLFELDDVPQTGEADAAGRAHRSADHGRRRRGHHREGRPRADPIRGGVRR